MVTKNERGREGNSSSALVWHCGDWGLFAIWTCRFSVNNLFPFPLATALLLGDVWMNRQSEVKMFLSAKTAPIVLAHLINFLVRRCYVTPCKFDPPCLFKIWIRLRQYIGADVLFPPILLALWMLISWIVKAGDWSGPIGYLQRFAYSSRQCLFIKLEQPKTEKMSFK